MNQLICIDDYNFQQHVQPYVGPDGETRMMGAIPRDYNALPVGCYAGIPAFSLPEMTDEEIEAAIVRKNADQSWLSDKREIGMYGQRIPSRDQNGRGYCWFHSGVSANLLVRARDNQPYADLSAYSGACIIKNFADQGGWGSEGVEWQLKHGCATSKTWPQKATDRKLVTPEMYAEAALYKPTGTWMDIQPRNKRALATCLCLDYPVICDFNWWAHSVCACRLISWNPFKILIWNSWGDTWSQFGMGELAGNKAIPDGMVALIEVRLAA